jgi:hypothetical protein
MRKSAYCSLALVAAALFGVASAEAQDFRWTGSLAPGKRLEIKNVSGDIRATLAAGTQIEVTARKTGRRSDPDDVRIEVVPFEDGVTICAVYPTGRRARRENSCESGRHWSSNTDNNDVQVDFTVSVPAGVVFAGLTVNGEMEAEGLRGDVEASSVNGSVRVSTTGLAEASTVNGSVSATLGRADWVGEAEFTTVNGGITLTLPASANTEVSAETVNGDLDTDFPLTVTGRFGPRRFRGTIGNGGRTLHLTTVNGSIRIRKAS